MRASLYHLQLNVGEDARSLAFYRELFGYFEYRLLDVAPDVLGFTNGTTDFWVYGTPREFPEYRADYYAVFFEDPDRLKLEVAHVPGVTDRSLA